ncbi:hypothetical protein [Dyadobacter psychrotolerans]|uniref:Uncharacterized protein n=1 Tax=Dyadobacter psychrotolerans TaxID=2541721 RepID=A0A4R5DT68_9BACT|nr:hypothetical protein [Dyadobacter psychrotolerans]TDE17589.1 hypothetical protein E0F88_06775 [Dyadobacter psychrotolerans]
MLKKSIFSAIILAVFGTVAVNAQSVDAGISTHNYKHPNKAAKAAAKKGPGVTVATTNTVQNNYKMQNRGSINTMPKYAERPASLIVIKSYEKEGVDINPLVSPRNYKTPNKSAAKSNLEVADYFNLKDSTNLPTID